MTFSSSGPFIYINMLFLKQEFYFQCVWIEVTKYIWASSSLIWLKEKQTCP